LIAAYLFFPVESTQNAAISCCVAEVPILPVQQLARVLLLLLLVLVSDWRSVLRRERRSALFSTVVF
jgi:hypothetical protein